MIPRPFDKTLTRRKDLAQRARRNLGAYRNLADADGGPAATMRLLWAMADVEAALWFETRGRMGDQHATALTVARKHGLEV